MTLESVKSWFKHLPRPETRELWWDNEVNRHSILWPPFKNWDLSVKFFFFFVPLSALSLLLLKRLHKISSPTFRIMRLSVGKKWVLSWNHYLYLIITLYCQNRQTWLCMYAFAQFVLFLCLCCHCVLILNLTW